MYKLSKLKIKSIIFMLLLVAVAIVAFAGCSVVDRMPTTNIATLTVATKEAQNVPAAGVGLIQDGESHFYLRGYADEAAGELFDRYTFFYIASLSKAFTALGIHYLAYNNYLSLNDPITAHIPWLEFRPVRGHAFSTNQLTIEHFLFHTSGLTTFNHSSLIPMIAGDDALYNGVRAINNSRLSFMPAAESSYASVNYTILGLVIENVSGMPFNEFTHSHILTPLGLSGGIKLCRYDAKDVGVLLGGYVPGWFAPRRREFPQATSMVPTGFMIANMYTLVHWLDLNLNPNTASVPFNYLIPALHEPSTLTGPYVGYNNALYAFGSGWRVRVPLTNASGVVTGQQNYSRHPGDAPNISLEIVVNFANQTAFVAVLNSVGGDARDFGNNVARILNGGRVTEVSRGGSLRVMDDFLSIFNIVLMLVIVDSLVHIALAVRTIIIKKHKAKRPVDKNLKRVVIGSVILFLALFITLVVPPMVLPTAFSLLAIWAPISLVAIVIFFNIAALMVAIRLTLKSIFLPQEQQLEQKINDVGMMKQI